MAAKKAPGLSDDHKAALAAGRAQARVVRDYLRAVRSHHPRPGRKRTPQSVARRLEVVDQTIAGASPDDDPVLLLELVQERLNLTAELEELRSRSSLYSLEEEFVAAAPDYAARKGITYEAWRTLGVPPAVLKRAGISA